MTYGTLEGATSKRLRRRKEGFEAGKVGRGEIIENCISF